jgi:hypothetical protein
MSFSCSLFRKNKSLAALVFIFCISLFGAISFSAESPIVTAQGGSKSSGNEMLKELKSGVDNLGKTKQEIINSYGKPWQKDTTGVKGRYDEKWIYSCETEEGMTYDCVYLYFMANRVVDVETF